MIREKLSNQRGTTLLELVAAIAITGLVTAGFGSVGYSMLHRGDYINARVDASIGMEEAARQISEDGQMAQSTDLVSGAQSVGSVTLSWIDPITGDSYQTVYALSGSDLQRSETVNGGTATVTIVARQVTNVGFSLLPNQTQVFEVDLASSGGNPSVNEVREYYVTLRAVG